MLQSPPAQPGMREDEVDTPALLIDLDALEYNLDRMAQMLAPSGARLRGHAKTHKSSVIAHLQMARGAVGQCVQKVGEAEILAWSGVPDILVSNEIVGPSKLARLAALARIARVAICADHSEQIVAIDAAAAKAGVKLSVLVEIGTTRCGAAPGPDTVALARQIDASAHLNFGGLQAYHGMAQHKRTPAERQALVDRLVESVQGTVHQLRKDGLDCAIVGGAGTGTFELEAASGLYNEIQAGSYIFMDVDYGLNLDDAGQPVATFRNSLFVLSTVMSTPSKNLSVLDAGLKALAVDSGLPAVWRQPGIRYVGASDEHGKLEVAAGARGPRLGEKLRLVPGHCDPTVDHYDWYVGVRGGRVECLWPISARGAMY